MTLSTSEVAVCCSNDSGKIVGALAQLIEQARVLDRDDRLVWRTFSQHLDLLVRERPRLLSRTTLERADRLRLSRIIGITVIAR